MVPAVLRRTWTKEACHGVHLSLADEDIWNMHAYSKKGLARGVDLTD